MKRRCAFATAAGLRNHNGASALHTKSKCGRRGRNVTAGVAMCENRSRTPEEEERQQGEELRLEDVMGYMENERVKPKIDMDADETMVMIKLRRMLSEEDFNRIFNSRDRRIGEL